MDDRLRRCAQHGPELRAYVEALVAAERADAELIVPIRQTGMGTISVVGTPQGCPQDAATIVTDDDGEA